MIKKVNNTRLKIDDIYRLPPASTTRFGQIRLRNSAHNFATPGRPRRRYKILYVLSVVRRWMEKSVSVVATSCALTALRSTRVLITHVPSVATNSPQR